MKKAISILLFSFYLILFVNAQQISPWLFGQNHWMDKSDEGKRPASKWLGSEEQDMNVAFPIEKH